MFRTGVLAFAALAALMGPAAARDLSLEAFFKGRTEAKGTFSAITGVKRSFDVTLTGRSKGKTFTLIEDFRYSDGERDRKTWRFTRTGPNTYRGTREDVVGETTVRIKGPVANFTYLVDLDPGPKTNIVRFYDKLVLADDGRTIANTATVWKYILPVARVRVDFTR